MAHSARKITEDYEIIFVNDGSKDNSLDRAVSLFKRDNKIKVIDLSRNFGHHRAIMTGLAHAGGDYIFLIDSDLEEDPELLEKFWDTLENSKDVDVIYGVQEKRKGRWFEKFSGWLFYTLFNMISDYKIPKNVSVIRLMTRRYVANLINHKEAHPVFAGLSVLTGFKQEKFYFKKKSKGKSEYNLKRKIGMLVNSVTSFSAKPLVYIFYFGFLIMLGSITVSLIVLYRKLFLGVAVGWTSIILSIWFFGGLIIFCIGIIGIYLEKVFIQTKNRPYSIIKEIYSREEKE
jgi:putative glycosyltransferase